MNAHLIPNAEHSAHKMQFTMQCIFFFQFIPIAHIKHNKHVFHINIEWLYVCLCFAFIFDVASHWANRSNLNANDRWNATHNLKKENCFDLCIYFADYFFL